MLKSALQPAQESEKPTTMDAKDRTFAAVVGVDSKANADESLDPETPSRTMKATKTGIPACEMDVSECDCDRRHSFAAERADSCTRNSRELSKMRRDEAMTYMSTSRMHVVLYSHSRRYRARRER